MANPSLQIGNGKFAIKENDLLGYSSSGTRFFPIPITMTRATLGSRVNPSGLIEDVELLGSELITNGDFSSSDLSSFTVIFATQEIVSQELKTTLNTSNGYGFTRVFFTAEIGKSYRILVDAKQGTSDGTQIKTQSGLTLTQSSSTTGDWSFEGIGVATSTSCEFRLQVNGSDGDFGFFDNVSVKEVTRDGLARVDYTDGTGSLLVEPQRTNVITYSEDFSQSIWNLLGAGTGVSPIVTSNYAISPDGTQNATRIQFNLDGGTTATDRSHIRYNSFSSQTDYYYCCYIKSANGQEQKLLWQHGGDDNEFTVTTEWQRVELDRNGFAETFAGFSLRGGISTVDTSDVLVWGFQVEQGSYPTSYIKTQGSSVTRNADQYTKTGISDKIGQTEGTMYFEFIDSDYSFSSIARALSISDGTYTNRIYIAQLSSGAMYCISSTGVEIQEANPGTRRGNIKVALGYKNNDYILYVNGLSVGDDTSFSVPACNQLYLGQEIGLAVNSLNKPYKEVKLYNTRLSNSELATLTTI